MGLFFSPGTAVTVRGDLRCNERYYMSGGKEWNVASSDMVAMAGQTVHIDGAQDEFRQYSIIEDDYYLWTDEMFEEYLNSAESEEAATDAELADFLCM